jgi:hypothetical protein
VPKSSKNLFRWSGLAALLGGILLPLHWILEFAMISSDSTLSDTLGFIATTLLVFGIMGIYSYQIKETRVLGFLGFLLTSISNCVSLAQSWLPGRGQLVGVPFHILFVAIWIGAALFTILIGQSNGAMQSDEALTTLHILSNKSDILIYTSVAGVLITSLMIATMTKWGFFKIRWMTVVWIIFFANIIMGVVVLRPLKKNILAIAELEGLAALQSPSISGTMPYSPSEVSSKFFFWLWQS